MVRRDRSLGKGAVLICCDVCNCRRHLRNFQMARKYLRHLPLRVERIEH